MITKTLSTAIIDLSMPASELLSGEPSLERARAEAAQAHLLLTGAGQSAHCSLWYQGTLGLIGHYQASSAEAAREILSSAFAVLSAHGCRQAIGPVSGSTWRQYRFITDRGADPLFFLEPDNHDRYPHDFLAASMQTCALYYSAATTTLDAIDQRVREKTAALSAAGVTIRALDLSNLEAELKVLHALSMQCFSENLLFSPIAGSEFCAMYSRLTPYLIPELILIAEQQGRPVGFVFCLPDVGGTPGTIILKSLARLPEPALAGLGNVLQAQAQANAAAAGFNRVIHALMHESNRSLILSHRYAGVIREYSLYAREL